MIQITDKNKKNCCGCGACALRCPKQCIVMERDGEGFLYPVVDKEKCVDCGLCVQVCPVLQELENKKQCKNEEEPVPKAIGGWHKDEEIRYDSSSGGAFSLFAIHVLKQGGIVYGASQDETFHVKHIGIERVDDLHKLRGSKYVQSDTNGVYRQIQQQLQDGRKVLFVGTPCQAAGLGSFLGKRYENLYIMDFICHGVPSPKVFESYVQYLEEKHGDKLVSFKFRSKDKMWNPTMQTGTTIGTGNGLVIRNYPAFKDPYMDGFLDDVFLRPSCYACAFKGTPKDYADITIADFWGVDKVDAQLHDGKGTSLVLLHNEHAVDVFDACKEDFYYKECDYHKATRRNPSIRKAVEWNPRRERFFKEYKTRSFEKVMRKYMTPVSWGFHKAVKIAWSILENIIKKIMTPLLGVVHMKWEEKNWDSFFQFVKFAMVGVTNVIVAYTINVTVLTLLQNFSFAYDYVIANIAAFLLSVLWSFYWNNKLVFTLSQGEKRSTVKTLFKTYASYAFTGLIVNNVLSTIWINVLGISKFISPLMNIPFSIPINFFMNKLWAYKKTDTKTEK